MPLPPPSVAPGAGHSNKFHTSVSSPALQAIQTISTIKMSGKRLLQLINDILDAAKMKQGGLVIKHQHVGTKWADVRRGVGNKGRCRGAS